MNLLHSLETTNTNQQQTENKKAENGFDINSFSLYVLKIRGEFMCLQEELNESDGLFILIKKQNDLKTNLLKMFVRSFHSSALRCFFL